jgi:hypothetical protein
MQQCEGEDFMSARLTALTATAVLLASTAFAAAQNDTYQNGQDQFSRNAPQKNKGQYSRNAMPDRAARVDSYAGNYRDSWNGGDPYAGRDWNYRDSYAGNYMDNGQYGWRAPAAGYYDFAPGYAGSPAYYGGGGYYDQAYWRGVYNVAPSFSPGFDPYAGTYFYGVAPW